MLCEKRKGYYFLHVQCQQIKFYVVTRILCGLHKLLMHKYKKLFEPVPKKAWGLISQLALFLQAFLSRIYSQIYVS